MIFFRLIVAATAVCSLAISRPACADIVLSQLIVDLQPGTHDREDLEVLNTGPETAFVAVKPTEVLNSGTPAETRVVNPDPAKLGLLVAPARIVLNPGQRKLIRIASITRSDRERVYRVTVVPVVGEISQERSGLKLLVGYDVLVLVRPLKPNRVLIGERHGNQLTIRNTGNVSVELVGGKQCASSGGDCATVEGGRVYAGAAKTFTIDPSRPIQYVTIVAGNAASQVF